MGSGWKREKKERPDVCLSAPPASAGGAVGLCTQTQSMPVRLRFAAV